MAEKPQVIRDIRDFKDGFEVPGHTVKRAIWEKIQQRLDPQVKTILDKLGTLVVDKKMALVYMASFVGSSPADLSPDAAQVYHLCAQLSALTKEVGELQQIARNLFDNEVYRLGHADLQRYGL